MIAEGHWGCLTMGCQDAEFFKNVTCILAPVGETNKLVIELVGTCCRICAVADQICNYEGF